MLVFALLVAICVVVSLTLPTGAPPPLPTPNGYTLIIQGKDMLTALPAEWDGNTSNFAKLGQQKLQTYVDANTNALQLVRSGLQEKIQVPLSFSSNGISAHLSDLAGLKHMAFTFVAEGQLAEMEQRPADAANSYLDTIQLGAECRRGGPLIDTLVGGAIVAIGTHELQNAVNQLDQKSAKEAAQRLEKIDAQESPWDQILQQERYWSYKAYPTWRRLLAALTPGSSTKQAEAKAKQKFDRQQTEARKLMIDLAARAYELDTGHKPGSINDLVPAYLKAVPKNPSTGNDFTYPP